MAYTRNAASHATAVLYIIENKAHFFEPVSCAMVPIVAIQGKNSRIKTRNAAAERGVKSPDFFKSTVMLSSESPLYSTPNVLTTSSFAGILVIRAILERQFRPNGLSTGSLQNLRGEIGVSAAHKATDKALQEL